MSFSEVDLVVVKSVRVLCMKPYAGHPNGCPNFGKKPRCPPQAPLIGDALDLSSPTFAVWTKFDLHSHVEKMRESHSDWSQRRLECCLYWQGTARKDLKLELKKFYESEQYLSSDLAFDSVELDTPEACGVDVTSTMESIGVVLEWPPKNFVYKVAVVGKRKASSDAGGR